MTQQRSAGVDHGIGNSNFFRVSEWLRIAGKKRNGLTMGVQAGVMVEEMVELLRTMTLASASGTSSVLLTEACRLLDDIADQLKTGESFLYFYDREATLDAMCDVDVTVNGVAYLGGFYKDAADTRVINSLFDKFNPDGTAVIKPGGKIGKREGWAAPDLSEFVGETFAPDEDDQPFHPMMEASRWAKEFRTQNPSVEIEDSALEQLIVQALLAGAQQEAHRATGFGGDAEIPGGVQQAVQQLNAEAEAGTNTINPAQ